MTAAINYGPTGIEAFRGDYIVRSKMVARREAMLWLCLILLPLGWLRLVMF